MPMLATESHIPGATTTKAACKVNQLGFAEFTTRASVVQCSSESETAQRIFGVAHHAGLR